MKLGKVPQLMVDALARKVADGVYAPGTVLGSERDLAKVFNVSRTTVKNAVEHLLGCGWLARDDERLLVLTDGVLQERGASAAEKPEVLFIRLTDNYLNNEIHQGMLEAPGAKNFNLCMVNAARERNDYSDILNRLPEQVYAVVLFPLELPQVKSAVKAAALRGVVVIQIDRLYSGINTPAVVADNLNAGVLATRHLLEAHGNRPVYYLGYYDAPSSAADRFSGWRQAMLGAGYWDYRQYVIPGYPPGSGEWVTGDSYKPELREFLVAHRGEKVSIFTVCDAMAVGAYQCCAELELTVGEDVFISACGNESFCDHLTPPLTSVNVPYYEMGREAIAMLDANAPHKRTSTWCSLLPVELKVRASSVGVQAACSLRSAGSR